MGGQADDILCSFRLSDEDAKKYKVIKDKFESHFVKKHNIIFEHARFNQQKQEDSEPVDSFITTLYKLAEHCSYRALHDEMIRDRLVVGIKDARKATARSRTYFGKGHNLTETVKQQQPLLRGEETNTTPIGPVHGKKLSSSKAEQGAIAHY